ncbi:MAG: homogentisate 1,2-dioxygenase [Gammaproteobacteria bacterium]
MTTSNDLQYLTGFGNEHETEALEGALPAGRFSPQKVNYGLYAEQFSSTAFTAPREHNRRNWYYRIRPSVAQGRYRPVDHGLVRTAPITEIPAPPEQLRWDPLDIPKKPTDFIDGLVTFAANGDARMQTGIGIHVYLANRSMQNRFFYNADGELLIVPQSGALMMHTECGQLMVSPGEICVIPRGMKFRVELPEESARGYICENYGAMLELPERGPVGANGFANDRDFLYPVAAYDDREGEFQMLCKFQGRFYAVDLDHSPLDVVAWVGTSGPYKYDLARFNVIGSISFDHPDPSIYTVLTSKSDTPGTANMDFVIFPPRWMVAEDTFRPPWYHRNIMSEFMGLIHGVYDAREEGFVPGGASLHNSMSPHGPDAAVFEKASNAELKPERYRDTLAFMFESRYVIAPTQFAMETPARQEDYQDCWQGIQKYFTGKQ